MNLYSVFGLFLTVLGIIVTWNSERNFFDIFPFLPTMAITSTSSELIRLNDRSVMLPSDTFLQCAGLGILRRLRYIHRGAHSTRRTRSTMTAIPGNIPVILSNERPSRRRCLSPCGVNLNYLRSLPEAFQHDFLFHEFTLTFNLIANGKHILACCPGGGLRARNMARTQRTPPSLMRDKID